MSLKTQFDGMVFENPLMPAAGPLNGDLEKLLFLHHAGVGGMVTKTISTQEPHIPKPCIYAEKDRVMNSELWSEHSYERWIDTFLPGYMAVKDRPLIISVGYSDQDMECLIPKLEPFADAFEVSTHYVGTDLKKIAHTVKTIRKLTSKPLYMKISPHIPSPEAFAKEVYEAGASGIVAINSVGPTMKIDIPKRKAIYGNDQGFVWTSGPIIKPIALAIVKKIKSAVPQMTVIGVGGIQSADDVIEFLLAGASGVQMLSSALIKGKQLYQQVISDLPEALKKHQFTSVEAVIRTHLEHSVKYEAGLPKLIESRCIRCGLCEKVCPYFAIEDPGVITFIDDKCFRCGLCVSRCPTQAIEMDI
ncbi:MAG: 4Fe-4S binding protein [Candidatus Izemoplasmatales bacterium]|jgi:dihydroorotate dehydrogenase (fumarate)|nr:4Fe-4S binding protein [Candidatus Izemoplasmatales bacterium]